MASVRSDREAGGGALKLGVELLRRGFSVDQVVYDYGDLCQALTELAAEKSELITVEEFHTFNRCLDSAIADAVLELGRQQARVITEQGEQTLSDMSEALLVAGLRAEESQENAQLLNTHLAAEIAERKRAEQELHQAIDQLASTNRHQDDFLAMLAHELRNPLAPIKNSAQILRMANSKDATIVRARVIRRRAGGDQIVLIAVSGYGRPEDKHKALEAGFDAHLTKPVDSGAFKQVLSELEMFKR